LVSELSDLSRAILLDTFPRKNLARLNGCLQKLPKSYSISRFFNFAVISYGFEITFKRAAWLSLGD